FLCQKNGGFVLPYGRRIEVQRRRTPLYEPYIGVYAAAAASVPGRTAAGNRHRYPVQRRGAVLKITKAFLEASDGHEIYYELFEPEAPVGHVHIVHVMAEHIAR